jgi:hypothetical protein
MTGEWVKGHLSVTPWQNTYIFSQVYGRENGRGREARGIPLPRTALPLTPVARPHWTAPELTDPVTRPSPPLPCPPLPSPPLPAHCPGPAHGSPPTSHSPVWPTLPSAWGGDLGRPSTMQPTSVHSLLPVPRSCCGAEGARRTHAQQASGGTCQ